MWPPFCDDVIKKFETLSQFFWKNTASFKNAITREPKNIFHFCLKFLKGESLKHNINYGF